MSKYTAAPWQVTKICEGNYQIEREHGVNQIEVIGTVILKENTKLIVAAPDLLEACKTALNVIGFGQDWDQISVAIAKATGTQP